MVLLLFLLPLRMHTPYPFLPFGMVGGVTKTLFLLLWLTKTRFLSEVFVCFRGQNNRTVFRVESLRMLNFLIIKINDVFLYHLVSC